MGVRLVNLAAGQSLVAIARNAESLDAANGGAEDVIAGDVVADDDGSADEGADEGGASEGGDQGGPETELNDDGPAGPGVGQ
jgi:hypothetical protein